MAGQKRIAIAPKRLTDLPNEILSTIMERLPLVSFFSSGRTCKVLRESSVSRRQSYLAAFPPFALIIKVYGKRTIYFSNIASNDTYNTRIFSYVRKTFRGISGGFLVFDDVTHRIWLTNPITGVTLDFSIPFSCISYDKVILVETFPDNDYLLVVLNRERKTLGIKRRTENNPWSMFPYYWQVEAFNIIDIAAFEDCVLGLTRMGCIIKLIYSNSSVAFETSVFKQRRFKDMSKLVFSNEKKIMVVEFDWFPNGPFKILCADKDAREWVDVNNLGNLALFIDETSVRACDPRCWGGLTNHVYHLDSNHCAWSVSPLGNSDVKTLPILREETTFTTPRSKARAWYFPHLAFSMPRLCTGDQM